ncbi:MAG: hypothetical protein PVJ50_07340, partial [Desulfobacterales bacterium]
DYLGNVITFYFDWDDVLGQDGLKKLREWYRLEKERRKKSKGISTRMSDSNLILRYSWKPKP